MSWWKSMFTMLIVLPLSFNCFAQSTTNTAPLADSGKQEFRRQAVKDTPNYSVAYRVLKNQLSQHPQNAELHYFLGYTIDRLNSNDGSRMAQSKRELTLQASEQFEIVNKLQPVYQGEQVTLDPYSKISSIWGSLAQAYLTRGSIDSARWAFTEGKKRGGFIEPVLDFNRQVLNSCDSNAIIITDGDNISIPTWYLQCIENCRTDITAVDGNLINASWYVKYLKAGGGLKISFTNEQIDTLSYMLWQPRQMEIVDPAGTSAKLSWELRPTYMNAYLLKGDRVLLDILAENLFSRPVYFVGDSDSSHNLFLGPHLQNEGLVSRLKKTPVDTVFISLNFVKYSIDHLQLADLQKSKDAMIVLNGFRWAYLSVMQQLSDRGDNLKAKEMLMQLKKKFSPAKLPYPSKDWEKYMADTEAYFDRL